MAVKVDCNCVGMIDCDMAEEHSELKVESRFSAVNSSQDLLRLPMLLSGSR
jgi:hypothetical protein